MQKANYQLRDEIKAYWSVRAETFDLQPGHEIFCDVERAAWHALILRHLGEGEGRAALDLGCGTGVVSHLMADLDYAVTGMDWAEPMLDRARSKAAARGRSIRFLLGDAEQTMEPDGAYSVLVARHLVWTLVDPAAPSRNGGACSGPEETCCSSTATSCRPPGLRGFAALFGRC